MVLGFHDTSLALEALQAPAQANETPLSVAPQAGGPQQWDDPTLRVAWFDTVGLPEKVRDKTQQQVEEIFEQIGVTIEWYEPSSVSNGEKPDEPYFLKVILFNKAPAAMGHPADAMGICIGTDFPPDAVWLFDPVIRRALQSSGRKSRPLSSVELGRAYGRVLAHEVIHAIANDMRHADSGLMAPTLQRSVLISAKKAVDAESKAAFLSGLARVQPGTPRPAADPPRQRPAIGAGTTSPMPPAPSDSRIS